MADDKGEYIYNSSIPFVEIASFFQNKIIESFRVALEKQYGVIIKP